MDLFSYHFEPFPLLLFGLVALFIGMAKMGVPGLGMAAVPVLAVVFGGKESSGIMLIILCLADLFAVFYYRRHAEWSHLIRLLPWAAVGVILGVAFGDFVDDHTFKKVMGFIIVIGVMLMVLQQRMLAGAITRYQFFLAPALGILGGFTSMVGNLAGPIMALYFLAMNFPKKEFIGTTAWFFLVLNWFKIPFHIFSWETIGLNTLLLDLSALPVVFLGAVIGAFIVKQIPEKIYRWFIIAATIAASVLMFL